MHKMTLAIAISSALALAACENTNNADISKTTAEPPPINQQSTPAPSESPAAPVEQAMQAGDQTQEQTDQAAFEAGSVDDNQAVPTPNTVDNVSDGVTEGTNTE